MNDVNYGYFKEDFCENELSNSKYNKHAHISHRWELEQREDDNFAYIKKPFTVYSSGTTGGPIHHAKTGKYLGCVGKDDKHLFKVAMTTIVSNDVSERFPVRKEKTVQLYYNGPNEYERHHLVSLSFGISEAFIKKQIMQGYESM